MTQKLIEVLPTLALELYSEAKKELKTLESHSELLAKCVLDLELVGAFDRVVRFAKGDVELASIYIDALVFSATKDDPSGIPSEDEFRNLGTEGYRGVAKYSLAPKYFKVGDPVAWLFGKEYSKIETGNALDIAYVAPIFPIALTIRQKGAWIAEYALTGIAATKEEQDAFFAAHDAAVKGLDDLINSIDSQ